MLRKTINIIVKVLIIFFILQSLSIPVTNALSRDEKFTTGDEFVEKGKSESQGVGSAIDTERS